MNPLLDRLHPYPFERLRELTRDITPNPALSPIGLGIGEPRHPAPELVKQALVEAEAFDMRTVTSGASSGWYVHDRSEGHRREVAGHPGGPLDRHEIDELSNVALTEGLRAGVAVFGGPTEPALVPPSTYRRLAADLRGNGVRVVADLAGEHLGAAVSGGVSLIKVGHDELIDAGLESLTGGGAEIFDWEVRSQIVDHKTHWEDWSRIHRLAHAKGLKTPATMLYGHIEEPRHRVDHVLRLRELQELLSRVQQQQEGGERDRKR